MEDLEMVDGPAEMGVPGVDDIQPKPVIGMEFDSESAAYDFYNFYGGSMGFKGHRKHDKRDYQTKNPRAETRTNCDALMAIKLIRQIGKYRVIDFVDIHNHPLVLSDLAHMLPSRRKISASQSSYELIGKEAGGRECLGYLKVDQKNYLRTRRQNMLAFGEAGSILKYFQDQALQNPSFFHVVQLDCEEQITNIFWADPKMLIDYAHFGDVVTFDTTFKLNREYRPFVVFIGFNNHREVIVFGAALISNVKQASTNIFTDQDAAMANVVSFVMPNVYHRLCTWHMMQNALKPMNSIFRGPGGVREVLGKFLYEYEEDEEFVMAWNAMLLDEKQYKEREAEYALSHKLPKIKVSVKTLIEVGKVYTKTIFEEFQEEYVDALELCITGRLDHFQEPDCILYLIAADRLRQVKRDGDGNLSCSCRLFEMRGVLCSHAIKVLKDAMNFTEIPSHYIQKSWTRVARAEVVQDYRGRDIKPEKKYPV
ncbi:protein FAR1-RELATED SEQUENCE 5-like [Rhododendron vialii]|uniref:protein FAR1-RELATED SEQUENCE 5-like n=1 Tax=Rhododendron vialii TaxID=182163 RepID=UPI00265E362D|nr:protein FAR1-RELATED SEQUENCE 5-like [Rhododendron vialii]